MSVTLRLLDSPPEDMDAWEPGMMWPLSLYDDEDSTGYSVVLCRQHDRLGHDWPIVWHTKDSQNGPRWEVTGEPPRITVRPSINVRGVWHGWITDGKLQEIGA